MIKINFYLLFGAVAPDLFKGISRMIPVEYESLFSPTHSPLFMLIVFYALSLLFHYNENFLIKRMIGMLIGLYNRSTSD